MYDVKVVLTDQFNSPEYSDKLPTSAFPASFGEEGCGFGKDTSDTYNVEAGKRGISSEGPIVSTIEEGTAPLIVESTTMVANLNVEMLGGKRASDFSSGGGIGNPTLFGGFGDMGGTSTTGVTFVAPGHAMAIKTGNTYLVMGHCKITTVSGRTGGDFHTGINIAKLKAILGITETLIPSTHLKNSLNIYVESGTRFTSSTPWNPSNPPYAYGLSMETDDNLNFYVGRYYDANGNFGGWPLNQQVYDNENTWDFTLTFTTP